MLRQQVIIICSGVSGIWRITYHSIWGWIIIVIFIQISVFKIFLKRRFLQRLMINACNAFFVIIWLIIFRQCIIFYSTIIGIWRTAYDVSWVCVINAIHIHYSVFYISCNRKIFLKLIIVICTTFSIAVWWVV